MYVIIEITEYLMSQAIQFQTLLPRVCDLGAEAMRCSPFMRSSARRSIRPHAAPFVLLLPHTTTIIITATQYHRQKCMLEKGLSRYRR